MFDQYGRHIPDYPGQQAWQDPAYLRHSQKPPYPTPPVPAPMPPASNAAGPQPVQQPMQQPAPQMMTPVQNSAPFNVRSEQEARDWPIAPGNSLTFINEAEGYVYTKTSLNQFDRPQFVKYKLVREGTQEAATTPAAPVEAPPVPVPVYALQRDVDAISGAVDAIKSEIEDFRTRLDGMAVKKPAARGKKEDDSDA